MKYIIEKTGKGKPSITITGVDYQKLKNGIYNIFINTEEKYLEEDELTECSMGDNSIGLATVSDKGAVLIINFITKRKDYNILWKQHKHKIEVMLIPGKNIKISKFKVMQKISTPKR